jgi:carboxylesterase
MLKVVPKLVPGAQPFLFPGDPSRRVGALVLHGLTAAPQEVYWLGEHLARQGVMIYGARLHGHGIDTRWMNRSRWQDWYASALDGYHMLRPHCDQVFVIGLSMGGLLALLLAANEPVAGVISLAGALRIKSDARPTHLLRYARLTVARYPRAHDVIDQRVRQLQAERGEPLTGRVAYYEHRAAGVSELLRLQAMVQAHLSRVAVPALLVYSEQDAVIPFAVMDELKQKLTASPAVQTLPLKDSNHILTNDVDMERVFAAVSDFLNEHTGKNL